MNALAVIGEQSNRFFLMPATIGGMKFHFDGPALSRSNRFPGIVGHRATTGTAGVADNGRLRPQVGEMKGGGGDFAFIETSKLMGGILEYQMGKGTVGGGIGALGRLGDRDQLSRILFYVGVFLGRLAGSQHQADGGSP